MAPPPTVLKSGLKSATKLAAKHKLIGLVAGDGSAHPAALVAEAASGMLSKLPMDGNDGSAQLLLLDAIKALHGRLEIDLARRHSAVLARLDVMDKRLRKVET